jgi:dipeptidyl aminopeptidase/acylaminoacyl peptidase
MPDGRVAVVAADEPTEEDERRRAERDDAIVWSEQRGHGKLRLLDPAARELHTADDLRGRHVAELAPRPDGGSLAVISWVSRENDPGAITSELHAVDPATGAAHDLGRVAGYARSPVWWADDGTWHVTYLAEPDPFGGFVVYDTVPGAAGPPRDLTTGMDVTPAGLAQVAGGPPLAVFESGLDTQIHRLDPGSLRFRCLSTSPAPIGSLTASRSGEVVAVLASSAYQPADVHAGPPGGPLSRISDTRPELRGIEWGTQERLSYKASDGLVLDGLLILPAGRSRADGPFPLVTLVHGGPDDRYADEFMLGVGPSHGGFMAAWAIGQTDRFKAAAMFAGISDWGTIAGAGEYGAMDGVLAGSFGWEGIGPHPHDRVSPISFASKVRTPVLIVHGEDDTNVPLGQAIYFHRALSRYGAEHDLVVYPRDPGSR